MAKSTVPRPGGKPARPRPDQSSMRSRAPADVSTADGPGMRPKLDGSADLRRLAAEVARLEDELARTREQVRELEARADIDPLTDAFNRRGFERELKRAASYVARYGGSAAVVYLDLDGFKQVNDDHGHAAGDAVLKAIVAALRARVRASDAVARLGGDEFALLLWNLDEHNAIAKAGALETAIGAMTISFGGETLSVGGSAGVAMLGAGAEPAETLARADAAMYARKNSRKKDAGR